MQRSCQTRSVEPRTRQQSLAAESRFKRICSVSSRVSIAIPVSALKPAFTLRSRKMQYQIDEKGRLIVTPITDDDDRLIIATLAALSAAEAVLFPVNCKAVGCTQASNDGLSSPPQCQAQEEKHQCTRQRTQNHDGLPHPTCDD